VSIETVLQAIEPMPPGSLVPVEWLRAQLVAGPCGESPEGDGEEGRGSLAGMTVEEVAAELDRSPSTVRGWCISGALKGYKFGREWRVKRSDVVAFLDRQAAADSEPQAPALGHSGRDKIGAYREILNGKGSQR
jgi:excisionase family DNA binding protein